MTAITYGALFTVIIIIIIVTTITFTSKECQVSVEGQKASSTCHCLDVSRESVTEMQTKNQTSTSMWFEFAYFISRDEDNPSGFLLDCNMCLQGGGFVSNVAPSVAHAWRKCGLKWLTSKAQFRRNRLKTCWFLSLSLSLSPSLSMKLFHWFCRTKTKQPQFELKQVYRTRGGLFRSVIQFYRYSTEKSEKRNGL